MKLQQEVFGFDTILKIKGLYFLLESFLFIDV